MLAALMFTSCTATLVQEWATSRKAPTEDFAPPAASVAEGKGQFLMRARSSGECRPGESAGPGQAAFPKFSPVRTGPKT